MDASPAFLDIFMTPPALVTVLFWRQVVGKYPRAVLEEPDLVLVKHWELFSCLKIEGL